MKKKNITFWFWLSIILCVVSMIGANFVQTDAYKVKVKEINWETPSGKMMSALLFTPITATAENPAPAIITSHGWYNNKEMQDMNFVEFSRRGYVVLSIDMYGHGDSDILDNSEYAYRGTGMTDAVELIATLPYVDTTRIAVTGHSNGARAANLAVDDDNNKEVQLISAVLLIGNDATYKNKDGEYYNKYGNRDVAIVAAQYDEFFFRVKNDQGIRSAPRDFINQPTAQSFLNFGIDPTKGEVRQAGTFYTQMIDGKEAIRAIFTPHEIHPWNTVSNATVRFSIDFFEKALGAPNPIPAQNLVWEWKEFFNVVGLVGFALFVWAFANVLLNAPYFKSLKTDQAVEPFPAPTGKAKVWFWLSLVLGAVVSFVSYLELPRIIDKIRPVFFVQPPVFLIGCWAVLNGLFIIILLLIGWHAFGGKSISLKERGVAIGWKQFGKSVLLALSVVAGAFLIVFIADYLFKVDFRLWVIPVKAFNADKISIILRYVPFFLIYYIVHSISVNSFNYVKQGKEWLNVFLLALFTDLGVLTYIAIQYGTFFTTGKSWTEQLANPLSNIYGIWLFPIVVYFPLAVILDRKLYKVTKNPYLGGIIFGLIMTIMACTNTITLVP